MALFASVVLALAGSSGSVVALACADSSDVTEAACCCPAPAPDGCCSSETQGEEHGPMGMPLDPADSGMCCLGDAVPSSAITYRPSRVRDDLRYCGVHAVPAGLSIALNAVCSTPVGGKGDRRVPAAHSSPAHILYSSLLR